MARRNGLALLGLMVAATLGLALVTPARATNTVYTWQGIGNAWDQSANWLPNTGYPGTGGETGDTASFTSVGEAQNLVDLGASGNIAVDFIVLQGTVASYTISATADPAPTLTIYQKVTQDGTDSVISCKVATSTNDLELNALVGKLTLSGAISGNKGIKKTGTTEVALTGDNSFSDTVTLVDGTLTVGHANALGNTANALSVSGGTLAIGAFSPTVGTLTMTGGQIAGGTGALTASALNLQKGTLGAKLASAGAVTKTTADTVALSADNSGLTGAVNIEAGTLSLSAGATLGSGAVTLGTGATDGTLEATGTTSLANAMTLAGAVNTIKVTGAAELTQTGVIGDAAANKALTKTGTGKLILQAASTHTYTGGTNINEGTLALGLSDQLDDASAVTISGGGALDLGGNSDTVGAVTLVDGSITGTTGSLKAASYEVRKGTVSATLDGATVATALTKTGTGTVTLSKATAYRGGTNVNDGILALGASNILNDADAVLIQGGTLALGTNSDTVGAVTLKSGGITGTGTLTGASYAVESGLISANLGGAVALNKTTGGTVTIGAANAAYTGAVNIDAGTLSLTAGTALGSGAVTLGSGSSDGTLQAVGTTALANAVTLAGTVNTIDVSGPAVQLTLTSPIGDEPAPNGGLTKTGTGKLILQAASTHTYTGGTNILGGTLALGLGNQLADASAVVVDGGTLDIAANSDTVGLVTLQGGGSIIGTTGVLTATSYDLQDGSASAILASGGGAVKNTDGSPGKGRVTLSGTNTFTGNVTINAGTLAFAKDASMGVPANTVTLAGGALGSSGVFRTTRTINVTAPGSGLSADAGKALVIDSVISAAGQSLEKTGAGTVYLSQSNNIGGAGQNVTLKDGKLSIYKHAALGPAATGLIFDGGTLEVTNGWTGGPWNLPDPTAHNMTVNAAGGGIYIMPGKGFVTTGTLAGSGNLTVTGSGQLRLTGTAAAFTGNIIGSYALGSTGRQETRIRDFTVLSSIAGVTLESGTIFALDNDGLRITEATPGVDVGRMKNDAPVTFRGGEFAVYGRNTGTATIYETVGKALFERGNSMIRITRPNSTSPVTLVFSGGYERTKGAVAHFLANNQGILGGPTAANDPRILFTGGIPNVNGIIPWATAQSTGTGATYAMGTAFAMYDATLGVKEAASTVGFLSGAVSTANLKVNVAENMTAASNPNSIIFDSATAAFIVDLGGNKLTVNSGGILKISANIVTINPGTGGSITSGVTDVDSELFFNLNSAGGMTLAAPITDNGTGKVTLVKTGYAGGARLILNAASTYSGGTILNGYDCLELNAAGATGSGLVTARQSTWIDYKAAGAAPGGIKLEDTSRMFVGAVLPAFVPGGETYQVGPNAAISANSLGNFVNLTYGTNLFVEPGGTLSEGAAGAVAQIKNLPTNANLFFGINGTVAGPETVSVGPGTPWAGLSTTPNGNSQLSQGTINPTGDFILRGAFQDSSNRRQLTLGSGTGLAQAVNIVTANPVTATIVGSVNMNGGAANYGNVTFVVGADADLLTANIATCFGGSGTNTAATKATGIIILPGGTLSPNGATSVNVPVEVMPDGRVLVDDRALTGIGTFTFVPGSIVEIGNAAALPLTGQVSVATIPVTSILRIGADNITNLKMMNPAFTYEISGGDRVITAGVSDININGGILTQDRSSDRTLKGTGQIIVPSGGTATIASTSGQTLYIGSANNSATEGQILAAGATLNIGTTQLIEGTPKQGVVRLRGVMNAQTMNVNGTKVRNSQAGNSFWGPSIENAASNILGDINVNGGALYLSGGANSDGTGIMATRLTTISTNPADRVAGRIILNANTHTEIGIPCGFATGPSGRIEITQPFVLNGACFPTDIRRIYVTRTGVTTATPQISLMDITMNPGSEFGGDEDNTNIRYSVKLNSIGTVSGDGMAGDLKIRKGPDDVEPINILRDPSLAAFDPGLRNYAVLQWGTTDATIGGRPIYGTLGTGVWVNMVYGSLYFNPGSVLNGVIDTRTVPTGGDQFVRIDGGRDGNVANRITGTGMVILGVNQNNGVEDIGILVDEVTEPAAPLTNATDIYIRVAANAISTDTDGQLRAQRGVNIDDAIDVGGYGIFTNVHPDAGARLELISQDNQSIVADLNLAAGSSELLAAGDLRFVRNVTGTGAQTLTIVGTGNIRLIGQMVGADLVVNTTANATYLTDSADLARTFDLNGRQVTITSGIVHMNPVLSAEGTNPLTGSFVMNGATSILYGRVNSIVAGDPPLATYNRPIRIETGGGGLGVAQQVAIATTSVGVAHFTDVTVADTAQVRGYKSGNQEIVVADLKLEGNASWANTGTSMPGVGNITGIDGVPAGHTLTINTSGDYNDTLFGSLTNANVVYANAHTNVKTLNLSSITAAGGAYTASFKLNRNKVSVLGTDYIQTNVDPGTGTLEALQGGRVISMFNTAPGSPAWGINLTINLGGKSWFMGRVVADPLTVSGDPRSGAGQFNGPIIVNNTDNDPLVYDAILSASRSGTANIAGCQYTFNNVQVANNAWVALDQDNARHVSNFVTATGTAAFASAWDDDDVCIGNVSGGGKLTLNIPVNTAGAGRRMDAVGVVSGAGTTLAVNFGAVGNIRLRAASNDWPGVPGFDVQNGGTFQAISGGAYFVEAWPEIQIGNGATLGHILVGDAGVTTGNNGFEVRHGDDGLSTAFGPKVDITLQYGGTLRGFVQQGVDTAITQVINAPITVNNLDDDRTKVDGIMASSKSDKTGSTQGSIIGTVQFQDVTLLDGSRVRADALNVRGTEAVLLGGPGGAVTVNSGKAYLVNTSSDTLVAVENTAGAGTLVLAGTSLWQVKGTIYGYGLQIGEGWTTPGPPPSGPLPGRALILPTADLSGLGAGGLDVWANGDLRLGVAFNEMLTVREAGWAYAYQAFNPGTLVLEKDSNLALLADGSFPAEPTMGAANLYIGKLNFTGTLVLNTGAGDPAKIGVYGADASINDPIAAGAAGVATVKFQDGATAAYAGAILALGDGVDPLTKVMIADMGPAAGATAVTIDRNMLIQNKSTYSGGTTIDSSGTANTSGASDNTVVVAHKNGLGTGNVTLQASSAVPPAPPLPGLPDRKTTLSL
ncbi:MAG: autotransporter-associated beta strand repeat-containing protein, partial [Planctomycetota bacterium]|nr:autotransporter-associated beta strand repeat-containing protein [Planctomycetota bacterium]